MDKKILVTQSLMPTYEEYAEAIKPLWDSHWLTNMGTFHKELEKKLKEYLNVAGLSLMVNGHLALEMTIQSFGFPKGSEVITTPFTFISTTHAIVRNGLVPVFCDVKAENGTIDEEKIEDLVTEKTVAILPVHVYGNMCNVSAIQEIADKFGLKVIYDAAHAFGVEYEGKGVGAYGDASCFSFHATKVFNTIEGGAVSFSDSKVYDKLYDLKNFGIHGEELVTNVGANAKMNEFCAIMGLCNLKHVDEAISKRKWVAEYYDAALKNVHGIQYLKKRDGQTENYAYYPIIVSDEYKMSRNELYSYMREHNVYSRKYFYPITADQACFKNKYKNVRLDVARDLSGRILCLPMHPYLDEETLDEVISCIV